VHNGSRQFRRHGLLSFVAGAVATGLVVTSPPAYADDGDTPAPPAPIIVPGNTVQGQATVSDAQPLPSAPGMTVPDPNKPVTVQNSTPKVETVAPYSIPDLPGTFTHKVTFFQGNNVKEQRVLAADTNGKALEPSRVRVAYLTEANEIWVFNPGTGTLDKTGQWPTVYAAPRGVAVHPLTDLFGGPGGPEWLETARAVAVGIAAAVITGGAVAAFAPGALAAGTAAVPLAW
jgi:hypothetical protein